MATCCTPLASVHEGYKLLLSRFLFDCEVCPLKMKCCPKAPSREVPRDVHEYARDLTRRLMRTKALLKSRNQRKRIEMRFAHLKVHHHFERMRLRGLSGARDEFVLAATVQNLKTLVLRALKPSLRLSRTCHLPEAAKLVSVASASTSPANECSKKPSNSITPTENLLFQQHRPKATDCQPQLSPNPESLSA